MFCLRVDLLTGRYRASDHRERTRAEWPPHPARLFSALVDAYAAAGKPADGADALRWLEAQPPPAVAAGPHVERTAPTVFVPINDDGSPPTLRERRPRHFPAVAPDEATVFFLWEEAEPTREQRTALGQMASGVPYLGHSASLVRVTPCVDLPPADLPILRPSPGGSLSLRVPKPGRLQTLEEAYANGRRPSVGSEQPYSSVVPGLTGGKEGQTPFEELFVFRCVEGPALPITTAMRVTEAARRAVLSRVGDGAPDFLHGHGAHPHAAWLALPFTGFPHADGHLMGIALALPREAPVADRRRVLRALAGFDTLKLWRDLEWQLERVAPSERARTLQAATWIGPAKRWSSVTPVLLDRFPKNKPGQSPADILAAACGHVGLPAPVSMRVGLDSALTGVPPAGDFQRQRATDGPGLPTRYGCHVTLEFDRPIRGPLLLGAGRYFGLGLFRPDDEKNFRP